jgi:membrane associated rhomboid family serine protease
LNLNHILFFLAIVSPLLVLMRAWRPGAPSRGWRLAAVTVLAVTTAAWILYPATAGYIGGFAWLLLLFVPAVGLRKMTQLATRGDYQAAGRLGASLQILHPSSELREQVRRFQRLQSNPQFETNFTTIPVKSQRAASAGRNPFQNAPAVLILMIINVLVFLFEIVSGGSNDSDVLHRMGALEPSAVANGEYWRLFTALFLHGGFLHLGFNLFALYVLAPPLEQSIGTMRFAACYLLSGLGSSIGVIALARLGLIQAAQLIGASGCIMGVIGAWGGFLVRHHQAPQAKERLANIALIVAIQIAFDLSTPQVSMAAHLSGLVAGFFLGLILAPKSAAGSI